MTETTPGPWGVDKWPLNADNAAQQLVADSHTEREWVGITTPPDDDGGYEHVAYCHPSNAPLIAAAPRMLQALRIAEEQYENFAYSGKDDGTLGVIRGAIASACQR